MTIYTILDSPIGPLTLTGDGESLTSLHMEDRSGAIAARRDDGAFAVARGQLEQYFAGERTRFELPLRATGTEFQRLVWDALARIPFAATTSYGRLAASIGRPRAMRAVGLANGRNPLAIVVPCHRVIGADGSLTGFGGGIERKRWLLEHERSAAGLATAPLQPAA